VLHTVDLGSDLHVSIIEENSPQDGRARNHLTAVIADVELFPGLPHWRVTLADSRGRSLAQRVAYERWTYGALIAGMLVVMAVGVVLTLRASARATELARAKTDFVSNVSHELKTPLALIRMFGETLGSGIVSDPEKRQEFYGIIRRESERLTHLIDNVLDASRIDRGTKRYDIREHDLVETAHAALDAYRPLFERAGFTVHTALPPMPVALAIDREAIIQSLVNLFQNVIKYSRDQRFVSVAIRTWVGTVSISVTDRGIGIPADQIDRIFEPYYRVARFDEAAIAGSGLGLAIVKHAVEAHGGRVEVVSALGKGTSFTIALPSAGARASGIPLPAPAGAIEAR
jgi:signal transduction histidine kinase